MSKVCNKKSTPKSCENGYVWDAEHSPVPKNLVVEVRTARISEVPYNSNAIGTEGGAPSCALEQRKSMMWTVSSLGTLVGTVVLSPLSDREVARAHMRMGGRGGRSWCTTPKVLYYLSCIGAVSVVVPSRSWVSGRRSSSPPCKRWPPTYTPMPPFNSSCNSPPPAPSAADTLFVCCRQQKHFQQLDEYSDMRVCTYTILHTKVCLPACQREGTFG